MSETPLININYCLKLVLQKYENLVTNKAGLDNKNGSDN